MSKKILSFAEVIILTLSALYIFLFYSTRYVEVAIPDVTPNPFYDVSEGDRFDPDPFIVDINDSANKIKSQAANVKILYDNLNKTGVNTGTLDNFSSKIKDDNVRRTLYVNLQKLGYNVGDYAGFSQELGYKPVKQQPKIAEEDGYLKKIYGGMNDAYGKNGKISPDAFNLSYDDFKNKIQSSSSYASKIYDGMNDAYGKNGSISQDAFTLSDSDFIKKVGVSYQNPVKNEALKAPGHPDHLYDTTYTATVYSWNEYKSITDFRGNSNQGISNRSDAIKFKDIHVFFLSLKKLSKNQVAIYSFLFNIAIVGWIIVIAFVFKIVYKLRIKQGSPSSA